MPTLMVLYDTSFLMNENQIPSFIWEGNEFPVDQHIIPVEVKQELARHLQSSEKGLSARKGRTLAAKIMAHSGYSEVSMDSVPTPPISEKLLGPDSEVDKKLIGFALRFLDAHPSNVVFLATHDGGIQTEVSTLQSQKMRNIFSPASKDTLSAWLAACADQEWERTQEKKMAEENRHFEEKHRLEMECNQRSLKRALVWASICFLCCLIFLPITCTTTNTVMVKEGIVFDDFEQQTVVKWGEVIVWGIFYSTVTFFWGRHR